MQKWCLVNATRLQPGDLLCDDSEMPTAEQGTGTPGHRDTGVPHAGSRSLRSQGHRHVPTHSLPLPRVLHPSAFHTLSHTRVPLIALIILQTPALRFALGQWEVTGATRAGSPVPQPPGHCNRCPTSCPRSSAGSHHGHTLLEVVPRRGGSKGGREEGAMEPL